jgi:hypothetical protein
MLHFAHRVHLVLRLHNNLKRKIPPTEFIGGRVDDPQNKQKLSPIHNSDLCKGDVFAEGGGA